MRRTLYLLALVGFGCGRSALVDETTEGGFVDGGRVDLARPPRPVDLSAPHSIDLAMPRPIDFAIPRPIDLAIPPCGPDNCQGCCQPDGSCANGYDPGACGFDGEACRACAMGDFCKGACIHPLVNCSAANCAGCCAGPNYCAIGLNHLYCGSQGQLCQACSAAESCVAQAGGGGQCGAVQTCKPANCRGCCDGDVCQQGMDDGACGTGGEACRSCGVGGTCKTAAPWGGYCAQTANCSPSNCAGCCYGNVCAVGTQPVACGKNGQACQSCARCVAGQCS